MPECFEFVGEFGFLGDEVFGFAAILIDVVEFPLAIVDAGVATDEFPWAFANGTGAEVVEVEDAVVFGSLVFEKRNE